MLRHMFVTQRRTGLISLAAIFGTFTVIVLLSLIGSPSPEMHGALAGLYLVIGGLVLTSTGFAELHDGKRSYSYLMLPASPAEKVIAVIGATALIWIPFALASYTLFSLFVAGLSALIFGEAVPLYNPVAPEVGRMVGDYVVAHAIVLFGAIYFRGKNLIKTVAALAGLGFAVAAIGGLLSWLLFRGAQQEIASLFMSPGVPSLAYEQLTRFTDLLTGTLRVVEVLGQYVLPPALWVLTWQRFRETEVAHGV
jgi:hypothetical protein